MGRIRTEQELLLVEGGEKQTASGELQEELEKYIKLMLRFRFFGFVRLIS